MGSLVSKAANGIGGAVANIFVAPVRTIFGGSCEGVCGGAWDVICFIQHLCVPNLARFFMILVLCYMTLLFFYLLFKLGICQCISRSLCKMCWVACESYCFALKHIIYFLFHKLKNTKRIDRRRRRAHLRNIEAEFDSSDDYHVYGSISSRRRKATDKKMKHFKRHCRSRSRQCHHHTRLNTWANVGTGRIGVDRSSRFKRPRVW